MTQPTAHPPTDRRRLSLPSLAVTALGALALVPCLAVAAYSVHEIVLDPEGHVSASEAAPALLGALAAATLVGLLTMGLLSLVARRGGPPFPVHLVASALALVGVLGALAALGSALALQWRASELEAAIAASRETPSDDWADPWYREQQVDEHRQGAGSAACCSAFILLLGAGAGLSTGILARRYRARRDELRPSDPAA